MSFKPSPLIQNLAATCKGDGLLRNDGQQITWWNRAVGYFKGRSPRHHFADMLVDLHLQDAGQTSIEILGRCIQISKEVTKELKDVGENSQYNSYHMPKAADKIRRLQIAVYGKVNEDNVEEVVTPIFAKFEQAAKTQDRALLERGIRELKPLVEYQGVLNVPVARQINKLWKTHRSKFENKESGRFFLVRVYRYAISLLFKTSPVNVIESVEKAIVFPPPLTLDKPAPPAPSAPRKPVLPPPKPRQRPLPAVYGHVFGTVRKNSLVEGLHTKPPLEGIQQLMVQISKIEDSRNVTSKALRAILWAQICAELFKVKNSFLLTVTSAFSVFDDSNNSNEDLLENFLDSVYSDDTLSIKYSDLLRKALVGNTKADDIEEAIICDASVVCGAQQATKADFDFLYFAEKDIKETLKNLCKDVKNLGTVLLYGGLDVVYTDKDHYGNLIALVKHLHAKDKTLFKTLMSRLPKDVTPPPSERKNAALEDAVALMVIKIIQRKAIKFE